MKFTNINHSALVAFCLNFDVDLSYRAINRYSYEISFRKKGDPGSYSTIINTQAPFSKEVTTMDIMYRIYNCLNLETGAEVDSIYSRFFLN